MLTHNEEDENYYGDDHENIYNLGPNLQEGNIQQIQMHKYSLEHNTIPLISLGEVPDEVKQFHSGESLGAALNLLLVERACPGTSISFHQDLLFCLLDLVSTWEASGCSASGQSSRSDRS